MRRSSPDRSLGPLRRQRRLAGGLRQSRCCWPAWPFRALSHRTRPRRRPGLKEKCLGCHDDADDEVGRRQVDDRAGRRLRPLGASQARLRRRATTLRSASSIRRTRSGAVKPQVCQDCHADEFKAIAGSIHGRRAAGDKAIKDCTGCHDSLHQVFKGGDPASPLSPVNQIKTCGGCHEEMMANYERSEHARALLKSGLVGRLALVLELPRQARHPPEDATPRRRRTTPRSPTPAASATAGILREWQESAHGALWKTANGGKKTSEAPVCSTCHEPHAIKRPDTAVVRDEVADRCGSCHAGGRQVLPRQLPRQGERAEEPEGCRLRRLPHAARQPAGIGPALEHPSGQPGQDLRRLPRERQRIVPELRPARRSDGPEAQSLRLPGLARHDRPAAGRVRLLRPARPAVAAARARRQAARRVRGRHTTRPARTCAASAACRWPCTSRS